MNEFVGLSQDWVGGKILFMYFLGVIPDGGEKHINKVPPRNPGTIPWKLRFCVFSMLVFFPPVFFLAFWCLLLRGFWPPSSWTTLTITVWKHRLLLLGSTRDLCAVPFRSAPARDLLWQEMLAGMYRSIQINYRQTLFLGEINCQLQIQNRAARRINFITETDLWEYQQKTSHYRYRFSPEIPINFHYRYRFRARNELIL